ncbi:MAG: ornithine cyclodeaminase family protein [Sneathiellaceae bacterium]
MQLLDDAQTRDALPFHDLIEALRGAFRDGAQVPLRHHHTIARPAVPPGTAAEPDATLLLMPAWTGPDAGAAAGPGTAGPGTADAGAAGPIGVKVVSVFPGNAARGLPAIGGLYLLLDGIDGHPLAVMDAAALTARRTAAASALAADYLARPDARQMLMVGAGALSPNLIAAHAAVRPIARVSIWNHNPERAAALAARLTAEGLDAVATEDLEGAAGAADLISCATLSRTPLIHGDWLRPGCHLDLVGAFTPEMREADDTALRRAQVFVDTREGATKEAGEIVQALQGGALTQEQIRADLHDLARGRHPGRQDAEAITLFKSVGTALEDLAAATLVARRHGLLPD